jgi:four helix bundle suffix protein
VTSREPRASRSGDRLVQPHGGYRQLKSFQNATVVYDATVAFCNRFISSRSRTHDQMVQAARSGKQNIVEGSVASGTSRKTELKLVGIARASLEELLQDCLDFLRQRKLAEWDKDDPRKRRIRALAHVTDKTYGTYAELIENGTPEVAANTLIVLVNQTNYLLDQQLRHLDRRFLDEGGVTERLYRLRKDRQRRA